MAIERGSEPVLDLLAARRWGWVGRPGAHDGSMPRAQAAGTGAALSGGMALLVSNVPWSAEGGDPVAAVASVLEVSASRVRSATLVKKSLDARHKRANWRATIRVEIDGEPAILKRQLPGVRAWTERDEERYGGDRPVVRKTWPAARRPIVVGAGPAGLFAALYLAEQGAQVTLLERGCAVEERVAAVNRNWQRKAPLDPENNVLFGEGGAGTFSDGKVYTRRRDGDLGYIFRRLVEFGADPEILNDSYAHLGTDKVRAILPRFRERLRALGVDLRFSTRVADLLVDDGVCRGVVLADGTALEGGPVLVAAGHSARDVGAMLVRAGVAAESRPIAIGARIEHPQSVIDEATYGKPRGELPAASYRLAYNPTKGRHAHTFCMCPGGMVVPATQHPQTVVVNGMSFAARRAFFANSAVIVEVSPADYGGEGPLAGYDFQARIERAAFAMSGDDRAPAQRFIDLVAGRTSAELPRTSYPFGIAPADLREVLPDYVVDGMIAAVRSFDHKLAGFAGPDAVLIAPETRTTSPVRFLRDERRESTTVRDLFPIGEGAGYGGGIVSCALDGYVAARAIVTTEAA